MELLLGAGVLLCIFGILLIFFWDKPVLLIYIIIISICILPVLYSYVGVPDKLKYILDIINIYVFIWALLRYRYYFGTMKLVIPIACIAAFFISTVISKFMNRENTLLYIWGVHSLFRFYIFYFSCCIFLKKRDIEKIFQTLVVLLYANVFFVTIQYFVQGLTDDFVGGLFGTIRGSNGQMNTYLVILTTFAFVSYLYKKIGIKQLILILTATVYIAALSELKALFFEIPMIAVILLLINRFTKKTLVIIVGGFLGGFVAINIFLFFYPDWAEFFQIDSIMNYLTKESYDQSVSLNRLNVLQYLYKNFMFDKNLKFFGVGIGNADSSLFGISSFYKQNESLRYYWFSYAKLFVENGIIGFLLYYGFFVSCILQVQRIGKQMGEIKEYCNIAVVLAVMAIVISVYNNTLSLEISYLLYFCLALPFIANKE